jgi:flagellar motility protein MotE (MotC chaperone)
VKPVRLIPVVILAVAALLVLKTLGLVMTGSYVLGGVMTVQAEEHAAKPAEGGEAADGTVTMPDEPTMADSSPTIDDTAPTLGQVEHAAAPAEGEHAEAPASEGEPATPAQGVTESADTGLPANMQAVCPPAEPVVIAAESATAEAVPAAAPEEGAAPPEASPDVGTDAANFAAGMTGPDCVNLVDAIPSQLGPNGQPQPLLGDDGQTMSEKAILERLAERRTELDTYQQELELRASLVDAAEKKIAERQATLEALETQISTLVDQRTAMETGQFAGIITLYENMKPKDAANIFNSLDMEVLLRVAKGMNPRKMSPILAAMDATRAQELTVRMAALADQPPEQMTPADISALPQIVGQ